MFHEPCLQGNVLTEPSSGGGLLLLRRKAPLSRRAVAYFLLRRSYWMNLCEDAGLKMFAFTTNRHEGFSMFITKTKRRNGARSWIAPGGPKMEECDLATAYWKLLSSRRRERADLSGAQAQDQNRSIFFSSRLVRRELPPIWVASSSGSLVSEALGMD